MSDVTRRYVTAVPLESETPAPYTPYIPLARFIPPSFLLCFALFAYFWGFLDARIRTRPGQMVADGINRTDQPTAPPSRTLCQPSFPIKLNRETQMALVNGRSKLAKILAEEGRWRRSPATAHQDSLAETGKLRTLREGTESIVFVQYGAQGPRPTITMLTGRSGAATTS